MRYKKIYEQDKPQPKKRNFRQLGLLALSFIAIYGIYAAGCQLEFKPIVLIYLGLLFVLLIAFVILNRGFDTKPPERSMLPDDWDEEKKTVFLTADKKRRKIARSLLFIIIPLLLTFAFDIIYLGFFAGLNN
ncbi:MAG: hypothetical protein ACYCWE_04885 [Eubacteriales bacterium]